MKRAIGFLGTVLLLFLSFGLYKGVYTVKAQEKEIRELDAAIAKETETIRVLKADWTYLNQPERLQLLARRHLTLAPTAATQIVIMANLPERGAPLEPPVASIVPSQLPFKAGARVVPSRLKRQTGTAPQAQVTP